MIKCSWQRLQIEIEWKIFENRKRWIEIENWRERLSRACVSLKISNLIVSKANEIVALRYDVMRICMKSKVQLLSRLHLSELRKKNERSWCFLKFIDFDFSKNMRCKSFLIRWDSDWRSRNKWWNERVNRQFLNANFDFLTCDIHLFYLLLCSCF